MDNSDTIKTVEWFFGYGGNHIGLKRAIPNLQLVAVCEIEAFAICGILEKMEQGRIEPAPIWNDCKTFPSEPFKNRVDLFVASYPCQPFSSAGSRKGTDDPRHLWPYVLNWLRVVRPTRCFFENVEGHITLGLSPVISDLEKAGYRTTWGIFSAAEVSAPHQRKRVFILAQLTGCFRGDLRGTYGVADANSEPRREQAERWIDDAKARSAGENVDDPYSEGLEGAIRESIQGRFKRSSIAVRNELADSDSKGLQRHGGHEQKHDSEGWQEQARQPWPSRPGEQQHEWEPPRTINLTLNPDWVETLMGLEVGWTGTGNRIDRLRLLGNGVVPQTAEKAWRVLNNQSKPVQKSIFNY